MTDVFKDNWTCWLLSDWKVSNLLLDVMYLASWRLDHRTDMFIDNWTWWAPPVRRGSAVLKKNLTSWLPSGWKVELLAGEYPPVGTTTQLPAPIGAKQKDRCTAGCCLLPQGWRIDNLLPEGWNFDQRQTCPDHKGTCYCYHQDKSYQDLKMCMILQSSSLRAFSVFHSIELTNSSSVRDNI